MTDKQATLDVITGDRWKNMRKGLSPNFREHLGNTANLNRVA